MTTTKLVVELMWVKDLRTKVARLKDDAIKWQDEAAWLKNGLDGAEGEMVTLKWFLAKVKCKATRLSFFH